MKDKNGNYYFILAKSPNGTLILKDLKQSHGELKEVDLNIRFSTPRGDGNEFVAFLKELKYDDSVFIKKVKEV